MGSELPKEPPKELSFWVLVWIALGVIALWAGTGFLLYDATMTTPIWGERGTFGDMFGSINALFSGLAFAGLIFTVLLQRQELQLQRHELKLQRDEIIESRKELTGQRQQLEMQSDTFIRQAFETTFFKLLESLDRTSRVNGGEVSRSFASVRESACSSLYGADISDDDLLGLYRSVIQPALKAHQEPLDSFFQLTLRTIQFIDGSQIENKKFYVDVLCSSLSHSQTCCLFYAMAIEEPWNSTLRSFVEQYGMLKYLPLNYLRSPDHQRAFKSSAFG